MSREAMKMALEAFDCFFPTPDGQLWFTQTGVKQIDDARQALQQALETEKQSVGLTDEEIDALLPEADGTTEEVMRKVEYRPGLWADEVGIDDAWSKSLVIEIIRAVEKHHGIGEKR